MPEGSGRCARSFALNSVSIALLAFGAATVATEALAQGASTPPTEADIREAIGPVISLIVWPLLFVSRIIWYLTEHSGAAILVSAVSAGVFAWRSMKSQAATVRLRETFATVNRDNWDRDVIRARTTLMRIKADLAKNAGSISKYAYESNPDASGISVPARDASAPEGDAAGQPRVPATGKSADELHHADDDEFFKTRTTLQTILSDYENVALGIKHGILDERFLYQWMRSVVIRDWVTLSPLVNEYRRIYKNRQIYIEFEGLSEAWGRDRSYRNNGRLNRSKRWLSIR